MTKDDLINTIVNKTGSSKKAAADALEAALDEITKALVKGDKVALTGFGTFQVSASEPS